MDSMSNPYANFGPQWMLRTSLDKELSAMEKLGSQGKIGEGSWLTGGAAAAPPPAAPAPGVSLPSSIGLPSSGGLPSSIQPSQAPAQVPSAVPVAPTLIDPGYAAKFGVNLTDPRFTTGMSRSPFGSGGSFSQKGRFYGQSYWGRR